ncbi:YaaL family protein [Halalkalibacter urbisdiaboli]|uniref:YaaL family protein n=1 Tax=Halalkalibacter urbisdiaboli TaxID=1960589 RepID=UPI000B441373|nr:YaaL family protein [Halalkalibacter urbisdiaboli]
MLFRRKGIIRKKENERLLENIEIMKQRYNNQKHVIYHSVEPSDEVVFRAKLTESLYTFLLREARVRKATKNKL